MKQIDGKFSTDGTRVFNTVSGIDIPEDEPLFILRARDHNALTAIHAYQTACEEECNELHLEGIQQVREKFCRFTADHPERMKQPGVTRHLRLDPDHEHRCGTAVAKKATPAARILGQRKAKEPCSDCVDGWCTMNCGPAVKR